jgi:uridine kinase
VSKIPYLLAITGPTSAGKTYFTKKLTESAKNMGLTLDLISTDDYYRDLSHLTMEERENVNYDDPKSINDTEFLESLVKLREGIPIQVPIYDYSIHNRTDKTRLITTPDIIVVEGLFAFSFDIIIPLYSLKVYVELDSDLRLIRRIQRDTKERGRTVNSVINQYINTIRPSQKKYVMQDKKFADIVINGDMDHSEIIKLILTYVKST